MVLPLCFHNISNICLQYDPTIPLQGICLKEKEHISIERIVQEYSAVALFMNNQGLKLLNGETNCDLFL
jgi:hypothetical protein